MGICIHAVNDAKKQVVELGKLPLEIEHIQGDREQIYQKVHERLVDFHCDQLANDEPYIRHIAEMLEKLEPDWVYYDTFHDDEIDNYTIVGSCYESSARDIGKTVAESYLEA